MKTFEYKSLMRSRDEVTTDAFNKLGSEGWELVTHIPETEFTFQTAIFKREKLPEPKPKISIAADMTVLRPNNFSIEGVWRSAENMYLGWEWSGEKKAYIPVNSTDNCETWHRVVI